MGDSRRQVGLAATTKTKGAGKADTGQPTRATPGGRASQRGEQQRSVEARLSILGAALSEFAEKGYEAASIRSIGKRAGLHFTLVTYHFKNKQVLWEATIAYYFKEIDEFWRAEMASMPSDNAFDLLRHRFHSFLKFTVTYPEFHKMMVYENRKNSPRMQWIMENFTKPIMEANFPNIAKAEKQGRIAKCDHLLFYYMLVGACSAMSSMSEQIQFASHLNPKSLDTTSEYWRIIDQIIFKNEDITPIQP